VTRVNQSAGDSTGCLFDPGEQVAGLGVEVGRTMFDQWSTAAFGVRTVPMVC
jgi:hypothetical protein